MWQIKPYTDIHHQKAEHIFPYDLQKVWQELQMDVVYLQLKILNFFHVFSIIRIIFKTFFKKINFWWW